jgi:hypothetical protein
MRTIHQSSPPSTSPHPSSSHPHPPVLTPWHLSSPHSPVLTPTNQSSPHQSSSPPTCPHLHPPVLIPIYQSSHRLIMQSSPHPPVLIPAHQSSSPHTRPHPPQTSHRPHSSVLIPIYQFLPAPPSFQPHPPFLKLFLLYETSIVRNLLPPPYPRM